MGYFFIDIETFVFENDDSSGLNPYRPESKILSIAYNYYDEFKLKDEHIKNPTILKEWEEGEKEILTKFWNFVRLKIENDKNLKFLGFNILKFDMTYLFGRLITNKIAEINEIYEVLYRRPHYIDLGQIAQVVNENRFHEFLNIGQKDTNKFFDFPVKKGTGKDVSKFYLEKDYEKIIEYIQEEFSFETLYIKLRRHVYAKKVYEKNDNTGN